METTPMFNKDELDTFFKKETLRNKKEKMSKEKRKILHNQYRIVIKTNRVCCGDCKRELPLRFTYKCCYCGIWFCRTCGEKHFKDE